MGRFARAGIFCLMGLAIAMARLIEVELRPALESNLELKPTAVLTQDSNTPAPAVPIPPAAKATVKQPSTQQNRTYVVRRGDTLSTISRRMYGTPNHWQQIRQANRGVLRNLKKMRSGTRLRIPNLPSQR